MQEKPYNLIGELAGFRFDTPALSDEVIENADLPAKGELYLLRAQIKALCADETLYVDCLKAEACLARGETAQPLHAVFRYTSPNTFVVFPTDGGAFRRYRDALEKARPVFAARLGADGENLCAQILSEISYFAGDLSAAAKASIVLSDYYKKEGHAVCSMLADYTRMRAHLGLAQIEDAHAAVGAIIRNAGASASCGIIYKTARAWLNLTTGWSGDNPRYRVAADGTERPALDDRTVAVQQGIHRLSSHEEAIAAFAARRGVEMITMRAYFMCIYRAILRYNATPQKRLDPALVTVFTIARDTGLVQPLIEYGRQIVPMLTAARDAAFFDAQWLDALIARANEYERGVRLFRDEG